MALYDIVAYTYNADLYCPDCTIKLVAGDEDYWHMFPEEALDQFAKALGINRQDEATYDSDDFPKVVFRDMLDGDEHCGHCHTELSEHAS